MHIVYKTGLSAEMEAWQLILFVSSEGSILPVLQKLSGVNRCARIFEVMDISDQTAIDYLIMSRKLSDS